MEETNQITDGSESTQSTENETTPTEPTNEPVFSVVATQLIKEAEEAAAKANKELEELKDRFLRDRAEWDNSRKRILREKEDAVKYAGEGILERILPVLDNFEMGMTAARTATDAKSIALGLDMVLGQFQQVMKELGIETIDAVGQTFDPHRHEALGHQESKDLPEGTVLAQVRKGYKLRDRLLRPASVFVAKSPEGEG